MRPGVQGEEREKLLEDRAKLVEEIKTLNAQPVGKSQAAINGRKEDLEALARKVNAIDRKLGRI